MNSRFETLDYYFHLDNRFYENVKKHKNYLEVLNEGLFENSPCRSIQDEPLSYPSKLLALFHLDAKSTLPNPKKCAQFAIPQWAAPEDKKLLNAVNIALINDAPLRPILIAYCEDAYK